MHSQEARGGAKAAAVLQKIGLSSAGEVVKRLSPGEVEELAAGFAAIDQLRPAERERLADESFHELTSARPVAAGPRSFAEQLLGRSIASGAGESDGASGRPGAAALRWVPESSADVLCDILQDEPPRMIAVVFAALRPSVAARVLAALPDAMKGEVLLALAQGQPPSAEAGTAILRRVDNLVLQLEAQRGNAGAGELAGLSFGVLSAVQVLRQCDRSTERSALSVLEERSPEIAERISQGIFSSMADLKWLEPRALQIVLRRMEMKELALALRGVNEQIREVCLSNLSGNMAADVKEEIDSGGPRPRREVEAAQDQILTTVRKLVEEGEIDLGGGEDLV